MAEDVSYWICKCGTANHLADGTCRVCTKKKPRIVRYLMFSGIVAVVLGGLIMSFERGDKSIEIRPASQSAFLANGEKYEEQLRQAANPIARQQVIHSKYRALARQVDVKDWMGVVTGINVMQGKGALKVDIYGATLVAGDAVSLNQSTLIDLNSASFAERLLRLKLNERVTVSGHFITNQAEMVDIGGASYLFHFDDLR